MGDRRIIPLVDDEEAIRRAAAIEHLHAEAVVADQATHRADPHQPARVLRERGGHRVGQAIAGADALEPWSEEWRPRIRVLGVQWRSRPDPEQHQQQP